MDDLISKQEALKAVSWDTEAYMAINMLPSVHPEWKMGHWVRNDNGTYSCSICQSWIPEEQHYYARYCLYCGADMRGEQDD